MTISAMTISARFWLLAIGISVIGKIMISDALNVLAQTIPAQNSPCSLPQLTSASPAQKYDMFGKDHFEAAVCGYLVIRTEKVWDETVTNAYFRILQFGNDDLRRSLQAAIEQGDRVNVMRQGKYEFNLGCFEENLVSGEDYDPIQPYITNDVQTQLGQSSEQRPINIILSFGQHPGGDCFCCNLAHTIRSY